MFDQLRRIPFIWLLSSIIFLALLPTLIVGCHYYSKKNEWRLALQAIEDARFKAESAYCRQAINLSLQAFYKNADHFYLDRTLEPLHFLRKERESLERLTDRWAYTGNESVEKRYAFLAGNENRLIFTESNLQKEYGIHEAVEGIAHPVEIDNQDLVEILSLIEGNFPSKPQLIITDFFLQKKEKISKNEVFELNFKLIKREFYK